MTPDPATLGAIAAAALAGTAVGWFHFASLSRVTDLLLAGRLAGVGLQVARFALLGGFLWICSRGGWPVLLAGALGLLAGRTLVLRRLG